MTTFGGIMTEFNELVKIRRSVRDYEDKEVPLDLVREIVDMAVLAPSSGNGQPWQFIIVRDQTMIRKLSEESKKNLLEMIEKNPTAPLSQYKALLSMADFNVFYNAPCVVFIIGEPVIRSLEVDCALAASYLMFAAADRGLGTCWVALGGHINDPDLRKAIGLPPDSSIIAPIILGYPNAVPPPTPRNEPVVLATI